MPGPTVNKFEGQLQHKGENVSFPEGEKVILRLTHQKSAQSFGVPIKADGSFNVGRMPIGKYSAVLERKKKKDRAQRKYGVPDGFEIAEGQTEYTVDLGDKWKAE